LSSFPESRVAEEVAWLWPPVQAADWCGVGNPGAVRDFTVLSDIEFEEVAADLLAAELNRPVERFGVGRDGGADLRWQLFSRLAFRPD
jgi:hypothetical protein